MTNIYKNPEKPVLKKKLFNAAIQALEADEWTVSKSSDKKHSHCSSVRVLYCELRGHKLVSIRTTQDQWFAFPRNKDNTGFDVLPDMDFVVVSSVDVVRAEPKRAFITVLNGNKVRENFDRLYEARLQAGHKMQPGRSVWMSVYGGECGGARFVGAGMGNTSNVTWTRDLESL